MTMLDRIAHHWDVFRDSWKSETERRKGRLGRFTEEADFLPAALEILEKPASPIGRAVLWSVICFIVLTLGWSVLGHVDVVATAQGKLIPISRVKIIQPSDYGVVRAIHVDDGQRVEAGDVLIDLDPTVTGADEESARQAWVRAEIDHARSTALLQYLDGGKAEFRINVDIPGTIGEVQQSLIHSQISEYEAQLAALRQEREERTADARVVDRQIDKLDETLPLVQEQLEARQELMEKGYSPRLTYLELKERYVGLLQDIEIQKENKAKAAAAITSLDRQVDKSREEFRKNIIADLVKAETDRAIAQQELAKASQINMLQQMISPIDGTIQQLAVHTVGGVVEPAQALMAVVPEGGPLVADAFVANKDIGFVREGDPVEVKLEAFPFTKYGVIHGTLMKLSTDAIQDENLGLVYEARISLDRDTILVEGRNVRLGPGMAITTEIKTGQRRLIEFLLAPLLKYKDEALRER